MKFIPNKKYQIHKENFYIGTIAMNNSTNVNILKNKGLLKIIKGLNSNNNNDTLGVEFFIHKSGLEPEKQARIFNIKHIIKVMNLEQCTIKHLIN